MSVTISSELSTLLAGALLLIATPALTFGQSDFDDCGVLIDGAQCTLFAAQSGGLYFVEDLGGFGTDDMVYVIGTLVPSCGSGCPDAEGCILDNSIEKFPCGPPVIFLRGDVDGNAVLNGLVDALYLLAWGFTSGPPPPCNDAADVDDDGTLNPLVDTLYLLAYSFMSPSPPPPAPFPECGSDPTDDPLFCDIIPAC